MNKLFTLALAFATFTSIALPVKSFANLKQTVCSNNECMYFRDVDLKFNNLNIPQYNQIVWGWGVYANKLNAQTISIPAGVEYKGPLEIIVQNQVVPGNSGALPFSGTFQYYGTKRVLCSMNTMADIEVHPGDVGVTTINLSNPTLESTGSQIYMQVDCKCVSGPMCKLD